MKKKMIIVDFKEWKKILKDKEHKDEWSRKFRSKKKSRKKTKNRLNKSKFKGLSIERAWENATLDFSKRKECSLALVSIEDEKIFGSLYPDRQTARAVRKKLKKNNIIKGYTVITVKEYIYSSRK